MDITAAMHSHVCELLDQNIQQRFIHATLTRPRPFAATTPSDPDGAVMHVWVGIFFWIKRCSHECEFCCHVKQFVLHVWGSLQACCYAICYRWSTNGKGKTLQLLKGVLRHRWADEGIDSLTTMHASGINCVEKKSKEIKRKLVGFCLTRILIRNGGVS